MSKFEFRQGKETVSSLTEALRKEVSAGVGREALAGTVEVDDKKYSPFELREMRREYEELVDEFRLGLSSELEKLQNDTDDEKLEGGWGRLTHMIEAYSDPKQASPDSKEALNRRNSMIELVSALEDANAESLNTYYAGYGSGSHKPGFDAVTGRYYTDSRKESGNANWKRVLLDSARKMVIYKTETNMWPGGNPYSKDLEQ